MAALRERLDDADRAVATLAEAVGATVPSLLLRDAAILRFIYSSKAVWKAASRLLYEVDGITATSPKSCVREARRQSYLSDPDAEAALRMIEDRNLAVHTYKSDLAAAIYQRLKSHAETLQRWLAAMRRAVADAELER